MYMRVGVAVQVNTYLRSESRSCARASRLERIESSSMPPRKRKQAARQETEPDPPAAASALDPAKMTVAALREELDSRGLDTCGKKAELVARLQAELAGSGSTQGPSPTKKSRKSKAKPKEEPVEEVRLTVERRRGR